MPAPDVHILPAGNDNQKYPHKKQIDSQRGILYNETINLGFCGRNRKTPDKLSKGKICRRACGRIRGQRKANPLNLRLLSGALFLRRMYLWIC